MASDRLLKLAAIGTLAGVFSGLFGVGGGTVIVPLLIFWFGYGERLATGTSLAAIVLIGLLGALAQGGLYGNVDVGTGRPPASVVVAVLSIELHLPYAQSLKDKRMVLRRVKDRLQKFNVAMAEVDHQDKWQRAALGIVAISTEAAHAERELAAAADEIERVEPGLIIRTEIEFLT